MKERKTKRMRKGGGGKNGNVVGGREREAISSFFFNRETRTVFKKGCLNVTSANIHDV